MSRLFYISHHGRDSAALLKLECSDIGQMKGDELLATFIGTPAQTLGQALMHFTAEATARCKRLANGEIPDVPEVILENAKANLARPLSETNRYTVVQTEQGFAIWISDGPDRFLLVD